MKNKKNPERNIENNKCENCVIELKGVNRYYEMGDNIVKALDGINIKIQK
jgi:hypothetical protein